MSIKLASAFIEITAEQHGVQQQIDKTLGGLKAGLGQVGGILATLGIGAGIGAVVGLGSKAIASAEEGAVAQQRLEGVVAATGGAAGFTADQLSAYADQLQATTTIADDHWREGMAKLLTYKSVQGEVFKSATKLAGDLAATGFGSVDSAANMLGKALENPTKGITALTRVGVTFTEAEKAKIAAMQASGDLLGAQNVVLAAVAGQVGGVAAAMAKTPVGHMQQLRNVLDDVYESIGNKLIGAMNGMLEAAIAIGTGIDWMIGAFQGVNNALGGFVTKAIVAVGTTWALNYAMIAASASGITLTGVLAAVKAALIKTGFGIAIVGIGLLVAGLVQLISVVGSWIGSLEPVKEAWARAEGTILLIYENLKHTFEAVMNAMVAVVNTIASAIAGMFGVTWTDIENGVGGMVASIIDWVTSMALDIAEWANVIANNMGAVWTAAKQAVWLFVMAAGDALLHFFTTFIPQGTLAALDYIIGFTIKTQGYFIAMVAAIGQAFYQLPILIADVLSGKGLEASMNNMMDAVTNRFRSVAAATNAEAGRWFDAAGERAAKAFDVKPSAGTIAAADALKGTMAGLAAEKAKLEAGREGTLAALKAKQDPVGDGNTIGQQDPSGKKKKAGKDSEIRGQFGFEEFAKKLQEQQFKTEDDIGKMAGLAEADKLVQAQQLEALKQVAENTKGGAGATTADD